MQIRFYRFILVAALTISVLPKGNTEVQIDLDKLRIASARSAKDLGLIDALATQYKKLNPGIEIDINSGGVLMVLNQGRNGKADVVITHHKPEEQRFTKQGFSLIRSQFAYTEYAVFGPPGDPLNISTEKDIVAVFKKFAENEVDFYAPSPQSGTNMKIEEIWTMAGINPDWIGYENTGSSGYANLLQSAEFGYYTVAEMGTYIANKEKLEGKLIPLYRDDPVLRNIYTVTVVNPAKVKGINEVQAVSFYQYLISEQGQDFVRKFAEETLKSTVLTPAAHFDSELRARLSQQALNKKTSDLRLTVMVSIGMLVLIVVSGMLFLKMRSIKQKHAESRIRTRALELAQEEIIKANKLLQQEIDERKATEIRLSNVIERLNASEAELKEYHDHLELLVKSRTDELENAINELNAFSYSVSHDLRSPLRSINGFSRALLEDYEDRLDSDAIDHIKRVVNASQRMDLLIDGLLQLSRITSQDIQYSSIDLSRIASEISDSIEFTQGNRNITIEIEQGLEARGDESLIRVMLQNLLNNAFKYSSTQNHSVVSFGRTKLKNRKVFFVRDNGVGFDMKFVDKIFHPFQRLHGEQEFDGCGIGLSTVQRIIQRHGGEIWAESQPGKGATFYFQLSTSQGSSVRTVNSSINQNLAH